MQTVEEVLADDEAFQLASYGGTELIDQQAREFAARVDDRYMDDTPEEAEERRERHQAWVEDQDG